MQLRQSLINQYLFCPKSFQLEHLQNARPGYRSHAALNGSVVHELLHMVHNGRWNLEPASMYDQIIHQMEFEGPEKLIPVDWNNRAAEVEKYRDMAVEIINHYRLKPYNRDARVILSEAPFTVKVGRVTFTGTVDQIRENPDGSLELLDFNLGPLASTIEQNVRCSRNFSTLQCPGTYRSSFLRNKDILSERMGAQCCFTIHVDV